MANKILINVTENKMLKYGKKIKFSKEVKYAKLFLNNKGIAKSLAKNRRMLTKKAHTNPRAKVIPEIIHIKSDIIQNPKGHKKAKIC